MVRGGSRVPVVCAIAIRWHASVGKPDVIKLDSSGTIGRLRDSRFSNFYWRIQQLENPLRRCHCRLQDVVLFAQILNRPKEPLRVLHKGDQHAKCGGSSYPVKRKQGFGIESDLQLRNVPLLQHVVPAEPDHAGDRN